MPTTIEEIWNCWLSSGFGQASGRGLASSVKGTKRVSGSLVRRICPMQRYVASITIFYGTGTLVPEFSFFRGNIVMSFGGA